MEGNIYTILKLPLLSGATVTPSVAPPMWVRVLGGVGVPDSCFKSYMLNSDRAKEMPKFADLGNL